MYFPANDSFFISANSNLGDSNFFLVFAMIPYSNSLMKMK